MKLNPNTESEYESYKTNNSKDPYSARVVSYGEDWANLMEKRMDSGEKIPDMAKETSHEADTNGITGYMYGAAVSALAHFWVHGEELRQWHNLKTQIRNEGQKANETGVVLNPAILNIG